MIYEMSKPIFREKYEKIIKSSSAGIAQIVVMVKDKI